ncbi:MAG: substrate-binding domain-containing protein [Lachnospiraceae bacterium]|nr:substrate-binding domain-containing protein [Lachnospiraceae bacterium]
MKRSSLIITIILIFCVLLLSLTWAYFRNSLDSLDLPDTSISETYDRHYVLIPDEENPVLWQAIYESAYEEASENSAYLELLSQDTGSAYSTADYLRILIASCVDGIILKPDGTDEVRELINDAVAENIPVVTVLEDDSDSERISYVGPNSYQLADTYTELALSRLDGADGEIMILLDAESVNPVQTLAAAQLTRYIEQQKAEGQDVSVSLYYLENSTDFDYEEGIRDLFVNHSPLPDVLICMEEVLTECVYQALIDYNEVGSTDIIGFYYSDQILDAIEKGIIPATLVVGMDEVGSYCIDALNEYHALGHTSSYYNVSLSLITRENVTDYLDNVQEEEG